MKKTTIGIVLIAWQLTGSASTVRIVQTNSAGDNISLIDPVTNKVVAEITGIEVNHGAADAPHGSRFFFINEADHTPDVVCGKMLEVIKKATLRVVRKNVSISTAAW